MAVVGITPEDAVDNFAILAALAGKGAEMATARITPGELHDLRALAAAVDEADDVVAANRHFHRGINLAARASRLLTYVRQAQRAVPGNYFELFPEQERRSRREHTALLDAMEQRRPQRGAPHHGGARPHRGRGPGQLAVRGGGPRRRVRSLIAQTVTVNRQLYDPPPSAERFNMRSTLARSSGVVNDRSSAAQRSRARPARPPPSGC